MYKYKVYADDGGPSYVLGFYRFRWVAWLRGTAHIMRAPYRSILIDKVWQEGL